MNPTESSDKTASTYKFLEEFCDSTGGWGHELHDNGEGLTSFSLETFQWAADRENNEKCSELYLHCDVRICDQNEESCEKTCARRKRRFALETRTVIRWGMMEEMGGQDKKV